MEFLQELLRNDDSETFHKAWSKLFLNPAEIRKIEGLIQASTANDLLSSGLNWNGGGWNTGTSSKRLHELTGIAMVTAEFEEYKNLYLFALALLWGIDVPSFALSPPAAEAAFALQQVLGGAAVPASASAPPARPSPQPAEAAAEAPEEVLMEWDEEVHPLAPELTQLWSEVQAGTRKFTLAHVLDSVPRFGDLPIKPPENNFRQQGKSTYDRQLRSYQQTLLHILRMLGAAYCSQEGLDSQTFFRMGWQLLSELYLKLQTDRKEASIPGSTPAAGPQLFGKDELQQVQAAAKVNNAGAWCNLFSVSRFRFCNAGRSFRPFQSRFRPFKGKGGKGQGKGFWRSSPWGGHGAQFAHVPGKGAKGKGTAHQAMAAKSSGHPFSAQVESSLEMVGPERPSMCPESAPKWCVPRFSRPRSASFSLPQGLRGGGRGKEINGGIRRAWSMPPLPVGRHQVSHPVVPAQEAGGEWLSQDQTHCRLSPDQQVFVPPSLPVGWLEGDISLFEEGNVGSQGRFKTCVFSPTQQCQIGPVHAHKHRASSLPVRLGRFWPKRAPPAVYVHYESSPENVEATRIVGVRLPRRHSHSGFHQSSSPENFGHCPPNFAGGGLCHKPKENVHQPGANFRAPWFSCRSKGWPVDGSQGQIEVHSEGAGQVGHTLPLNPPKNGCHFGGHPQFSDGHALSSSIQQPHASVYNGTPQSWLGYPSPNFLGFKTRGLGIEGPLAQLDRAPLFARKNETHSTFRLQPTWMGRSGFNPQFRHSGILAVSRAVTYKRQRIVCRRPNNQVVCEPQVHRPPLCGQFSRIFLPPQGRGEEATFEQIDAGSLGLVPGAQSSYHHDLDSVGTVRSRRFKPHTVGFRGLHFSPRNFSGHPPPFFDLDTTRVGHVRLPREPQIAKLLCPVSPLGSKFGRRPPLLIGGGRELLCKPSLEPGQPMAPSPMATPQNKVPYGGTAVGFHLMVAPINKAEGTPQSRHRSGPSSGTLQQLHGPENACHPVAPDLRTFIRKLLEEQQVSDENITLYLSQLPSLPRYQSAFAHFWHQCCANGVQVSTATLSTLAGELVRLFHQKPHQARNAYSALLLLPGLDQLRFSPLLRPCRRQWSLSNPKYSTFWSASTVVQKLAEKPLDWSSLSAVRDRLILAWRLIQLTRSIDLARLYRRLSYVEDRPFVWIHRKGWPRPRWEEVVRLDACPAISPFHLLQCYVALTSFLPPDSVVLRALKAPHPPISSNTIGSLTRRLLSSFGVPMSVWGPHSTRGAGVLMYKQMGLSSEEVCEIGKWKNTSAFSSHYLRLGAPKRAAQELGSLVHTVSSWGSAESDQSRTPGTNLDPGGSDWEDEAQSQDEPTLPPKKRPASPPQDPPPKFQFAAPRRRQPPTKK